MAFTPNQNSVVASVDVEMYLSSKSNAEALAGGKLYFWQDTQRATPMAVYKQDLGSGPPTYTYSALPNPITLSASGCPMDGAGNNIAIYYWPFNSGTGLTQQYYVQCFDASGNMQFTREAWPPLSSISAIGGSSALNEIAAGRLTLTTGVPVTTTDVTAATTLYYTPYKGSGITLLVNGLWVPFSFAELSIAVPSTTNTNYDVFVTTNPASPTSVTLVLGGWTNSTTRAVPLLLTNGVYVNSAITYARYVGTIRTTAVAGQTEDSVANRFVWNYNNRVEKQMSATDASASWTYSTATWRQARANTANQLNAIIGVAEDVITAQIVGAASNSSGSATNFYNGIGVNSVIATSGIVGTAQSDTSSSGINTLSASYKGYPGIGYNYLAWLEYSVANATTTFYGTSAAVYQNGINGTILC